MWGDGSWPLVLRGASRGREKYPWTPAAVWRCSWLMMALSVIIFDLSGQISWASVYTFPQWSHTYHNVSAVGWILSEEITPSCVHVVGEGTSGTPRNKKERITIEIHFIMETFKPVVVYSILRLVLHRRHFWHWYVSTFQQPKSDTTLKKKLVIYSAWQERKCHDGVFFFLSPNKLRPSKWKWRIDWNTFLSFFFFPTLT